jgi:tryptophan-rich sensory protein
VSAVIAAVVWVGVTMTVGALASPIGPWYRALNKPSWQPPDWLFGPVWTVIFVLAASAGVVAWHSPAATSAGRALLVLTYTINSVFNTLWSVLFFTLRRPDWALFEVPALWVSILGLMVAVRPLAPRATWLLLPYLVWVSFAAVLNFAIIRLND